MKASDCVEVGATLGLRHRQGVGNFDEPSGWHKRRFGCQSIQQGSRLRRFVVEQPSPSKRTISDKCRAHQPKVPHSRSPAKT